MANAYEAIHHDLVLARQGKRTDQEMVELAKAIIDAGLLANASPGMLALVQFVLQEGFISYGGAYGQRN